MSRFLLIFLVYFISAASVLGQNGKIISKRLVDLSQTPIWEKISQSDTLKLKYSYLENLNFYIIQYHSDSLVIKGIVVEPKKEGKFPVVIFNRGGNRDFASLNIETIINYTAKLAVEGYVVIGSNYREQDEFGGAEINDVLCLTETIKEIEKADSSRIGMFGWSRGGMMTYLALKNSNKIKTAIVGNGPTDLFNTIAERPVIETKVLSECIPYYFENKEAELKKRSAIYWADELNKESSLLILCGTNDERVSYIQAEQMAERLAKLDYSFELKKYETDHFFTDKKDELNDAVIVWFNKEL
jgi:dipeptidyl aminopeptidase/acylaminoacyl peptidase